MNFDKGFWSNVLRDSDGSPSSSRLLTACIVFSALVWVSFLTIRHKELPNLQPVGEFVCTTTLALYGVNKLSSSASTIFGSTTTKDKT